MKLHIAALVLAVSYSSLAKARTPPLGPNELVLTCKLVEIVQQVRGPKFSMKPLTLVMHDPSGFRAVASVILDGRGYTTDGYILKNVNAALPRVVDFTSSRASRLYLGGQESPYFGCSRDPL